jgi:hypothetical protein
MGFWDKETYGERAAAARTKANDHEWEQRRAYDNERDYVTRNRDHKRAVFETERSLAAREGRAPRYFSPEQVEDLPLPQAPQSAGWDPALVRIAVILIAALVVFSIVGGMISMVARYLPGIAQLLILTAAAVTAVWLLLRLLAKGDETKLATAELWNPVRLAKTAYTKTRNAIDKSRGQKNGQSNDRHYSGGGHDGS